MATPPIAEQHAGRVLSGRYRLLGAIGTGASATVHLADDGTLRRRVAVKVLHPGLAADEAFLRRFRAEAQAAAALSHPNIMAVYDWGEDDTTPYLVLELLSGGSLRSILDRGHRLTQSQALVVGLEAARALDVAHRRGFVHRDIKPANLLFGEDGRLRIADFGLARALSEAAWSEPGGGLVGTARYAAPEQASGERVDGKADVYSLALVLVEAVTGEVPKLGGSALATIKLRADAPIPVPDALGPLQPILQRALQPDPTARPDAAELTQSLLVTARELDRPTPLPLAGIEDPEIDAAIHDVTVLPSSDPDRTILGDQTTFAPVADAPAAKKRRWKRIVIPLLVVAALVAGGLIAYNATAPPTVDVPNVTGMTEDAAREEIAAALAANEDDDVVWEITTVEEHSDGVALDSVIRTEPGTGADLADDGELVLVISLGPEPVPVPELVAVDRAGAEALLEDAQLTLGEVADEASETIPLGEVTGWSVDGVEKPTEVPKFSAVDIRISTGPAPRTVPDLRGAPADQARADLEEMGLVVAPIEEFSDDVEAGRVIATRPGSGEQLNKGDTVELVVSKGPDLVEVPNVIGMSLDEALDVLERSDFNVEAEGPPRGRVFESDPSAGTRARRGGTVTIYLRR
ncbi:MAG TPA: PASTA domain-containing protein [Acidimicrobiales bacterium]|nr:PASTA domain-containing protein [Acidimicrobiales bacterium]